MPEHKKTYLIVGLGRFGRSLCESLTASGQTVIGVDIDHAVVNEMADKIDIAAQLDVADEGAFVKIGAKEADIAIVTIGEGIEASILSTSILVEMGIKTVIARACNVRHAKVLKRIGAHKIVMPEWDMGQRLADLLVRPWYSSVTNIEGGDFVMGKIKPLPEMIGKSIADLRFSQKYNSVVILVECEGKQFAPTATRVFEKQDSMWVLAHRKDMDKLLDKKSSDIGLIEVLDLPELG
ncbi:MAG: TrkA family potassium uptake protein [Synergistaceae bacterium]